MSQQNTWISLNQIHHWVWIPCTLLWREPLLFESSLTILPSFCGLWPHRLPAMKLVVVAWLIAYGVVTKPEAPCGTAATWWRCSPRAGIKVVDQVPLPSYTTAPLLLQKYSPWKCSGVQTGNPQRVDAEVFSQGKQEVVLEEESMSWSQSTWKTDVVKEGKEKEE